MDPKAKAHWLAGNTCLGLAVYVGFVLDVAALRYLTTAFIWVMVGVYLSVLRSPDLRTKSRVRPMLSIVEWGFNLLVVGVLIYSEAYVTGAAYMTSCVLLDSIYYLSKPVNRQT